MSRQDRPDLYCARCRLPLDARSLALGEPICNWCRIPTPAELGNWSTGTTVTGDGAQPITPKVKGLSVGGRLPASASPIMEQRTGASAATGGTAVAGTPSPTPPPQSAVVLSPDAGMRLSHLLFDLLRPTGGWNDVTEVVIYPESRRIGLVLP